MGLAYTNPPPTTNLNAEAILYQSRNSTWSAFAGVPLTPGTEFKPKVGLNYHLKF